MSVSVSLSHALRCLVAPLGVLVATAAWAQVPDSGRGQALYENHCQRCHSSSLHKRVNRIPVTRGEVRELVEQWQMQQKLGWGVQEVNDVVEYLSRTQYRFD